MNLRRRALAPALLAALAACAGASTPAGPFRAADPNQVVADDENAAHADVGGVAVRATLGGWRGEPKDLEQRLTPVDVTVHNGTRRPLRLGPESFTLAAGDARWRVLDQDAISRALAGLTGFRRPRPPQTGAVGGPTFPGYDNPRPYGPGSAAPANAPVPSADKWYPTQQLSGTLAPGEKTSVVLYFETPARTLRSAALDIDLVAGDGSKVGTVSLPFRKE